MDKSTLARQCLDLLTRWLITRDPKDWDDYLGLIKKYEAQKGH